MIPKGDKGDRGENGQNGTSISITSTGTDTAGNTVVHFSDGKSVTIPKGQNGTSIGIRTHTSKW